MDVKIGKSKAHIAGNSQTIAKMCNLIVADFDPIEVARELVRGSSVLLA